MTLKTKQSIQLESSWKSVLNDEFDKEYFQKIVYFLKQEKQKQKIIFPPGPEIFKAFELTPFDIVKVVILGQDPYHNPGEAMGLSFSVPVGVKIPPSLKNIYKEIHEDLGLVIPSHGDLTSWAKQGIFLLNAMLTVEKNQAGSHKNIGWQSFTDAVIQQLSARRQNLIFMLWGNFAKSKKALIDETKHLVLEAAHPSPLAGGAFFGSKHFSQANNYLMKSGLKPIDWTIE
ncbi:MAG: uracil-DNA glycosylase [Saprospiraceae bacterium]